MDRDPRDHRRLIAVGILVAGLGSLGALVVMVLTGIEKVKTGHGLDTYRTYWLVEFNWVAFLVLLVVLVVAIAGAAWFRYLEWRELEQLRKKYGQKES
jgi:uncharacterized membrane protein